MDAAGYLSNRRLARELGTDGSLIGKWRTGKVKEIQSLLHRRNLPILLGTPPDYFSDPPKGDRIAQLEEEVEALWMSLQDAHISYESLEGRVTALEKPLARTRGAGGAKRQRRTDP